MRQARRYSIGRRPTARVKRSKNADRESPALFASSATVHGALGIAMHLPDRHREPRVGQAAQQPRRRAFALRRAQRLDQQHLDETRQHEVAARPPLAGFLADEPDQRRKPLDAADVNHAGSSDTSNAASGESKTK